MIKYILMKLWISFILCLSVGIVSAQDYKDVAPIFFKRCTSCHHEGGAGPFPFMGYTETVQQASDIYTALADGTMPPWSPDTTYTRFLHERIITAAEKTAIQNWILNGTPAGDTTLAPAPPVYTSYQLQGTPSLELQIPNFVSNAVTQDSYVCFALPTNLSQDRVLRAFELIPGNASIVHHILVNCDTTGTSVNDLSGTCFTIPGQIGIGGYAPGAPPTIFPGQSPMKVGIPIKAGSNIVLQIHYPAGSAGVMDSTRIRLYFYPLNEPGIRPVGASPLLQNWSLVMPPNIVSTYSAQLPASPLSVSILATFPHSHLLCTSLINYAYAGTDTVPLIRINDWDFEWQGYYNYRYPVKVPSGYVMKATHVYDNTSSNPNNPNNPPQQVYAGFSTTDEMLFDSYQFTYYLPGDEFIDMEAILANDTLLLSQGAAVESANHVFSAAFPNPASGNITIRTDTNDPATSVFIYNMLGHKVAVLERGEIISGNYFTSWDGKNMMGEKASPGIYYYSVSAGNLKSGGKIILLP
jgi:hypothetical protein